MTMMNDYKQVEVTFVVLPIRSINFPVEDNFTALIRNSLYSKTCTAVMN